MLIWDSDDYGTANRCLRLVPPLILRDLKDLPGVNNQQTMATPRRCERAVILDQFFTNRLASSKPDPSVSLIEREGK